mmetsp:Transcript_34956/g.82872  ORF Transcript_34956/g.82872 Transcript_34956/m.82872 type:complete len:170 (+) Transcript_34956:55-564(+)
MGDDDANRGALTLRIWGYYGFGTLLLTSSAMFVILWAYLIHVDIVGNLSEYPRTGLIPVHSEMWSVIVLLCISCVDCGLSYGGLYATSEAKEFGLTVYWAGKAATAITYLSIFCITTSWNFAEWAVAAIYMIFSVATCTLAFFLEQKLKTGGEEAQSAGFEAFQYSRVA